MDFSTRDLRGVEDARELQLRDKITGEPLADENGPVIVLVRSSASRAYQRELRAEARAKVAQAKAKRHGKDEEARALEDLQQEMVKSAARLIVGFRNVAWEGRPATAEDAPLILDTTFLSIKHLMASDEEKADGTWRRPSYAQQVLDYAADEGNYLGESEAA